MANNRRRAGGYIPGPIGSFGSSLLSGSGIIFFSLIAIVIGGGLLLSGGNPLPNKQLTEPEQGTYEIDEDSLKELDDGRQNLQLKTIRFKECKGQASAVLFVDRSGSMGQNNKLNILKQALNGFIDQMGDESVTGLISYSTDVTENVSIDFFKNNSSQMRSAISSLIPDGGTRTRNAFTFALNKVVDAKNKFPDKEHVLVFLSDGIPEAGSEPEKTCSAPACSLDRNRCFETTQDPTNAAFGPDIAQQIKDAGIRVFSIALYDSSDTCFQNDLRAMMQRIASANSYYETPNPSDLDRIYSEISTKICESIGAKP